MPLKVWCLFKPWKLDKSYMYYDVSFWSPERLIPPFYPKCSHNRMVIYFGVLILARRRKTFPLKFSNASS